MDRQNFLILSWDEYFKASLKLSELIIEDMFRPDIIVTIARGGWVVGRILSDLLDISETASLVIRFYKDVGEKGEKPVLKQALNVDVLGLKVLLVDDVADTGQTLMLARQHVLEQGADIVKTATPYIKPWSKYIPDYWVYKTDKWIVFPYEIRETITTLVKKIIEEGFTSEKEIIDRLVILGFGRSIAEYLVPKILNTLRT